ncbi:GMC oxidoreductase-domain-containing protein [Flagelloscypha sp. PMI_526]|nr:GMC oxidoreductase-domain-containing protein [Flagelloscypha sp. PMI_526]
MAGHMQVALRGSCPKSHILNRNGALYAPLCALQNTSHIKFSRIPEGASIFDQVADPTASNEGPHYEQLINNNWVFNDPLPDTSYFLTMLHFLSSPISHGSVRLNPSDPNGMALIDPGYLNEEFDVFVPRTALRESIQYMRAPAWQKFNVTPHFTVADNDNTLTEIIRNYVGGGVRCVGTARMVSHDSTDGVIGPDFNLKGVDGLRIVDASVIPYIPSGHTMAVVYALAERASDVIRGV